MTLMTNFLNEMRDAIKDEIGTDWSHVAIGTGTTTPAVGDTTLTTEVLRKAQQEASSTTNTKTVSMWVASTEANGNDITEVGVLNAGVGGTLWCHNTFSAITKASDIEIWFDLTTTITVTES